MRRSALVLKKTGGGVKRIVIFLIDVYRYAVSPLFGGTCRFHPTCSAYAKEAIDKHGIVKGIWLSGGRVCRCHPWHQGDFIDPVP